MYRIMIVEDDRGIADAIRMQTEMWDLQVQCAQNFRNVMEEFSAFDPHLVLLNTADQTMHYQEQEIPLSKNEYRILLTLMENKTIDS